MTAPISPAPISLSGALHDEIARRAGAWTDRIGQAVTIDRHKLIAQGARDMALWLMIAHQLGWSQNETLEPVELRGPLSLALECVDPKALPESHEDWRRMRKSAAATLAAMRDHCDDTPAAARRLRGLRAIELHLAIAHEHFLARHPDPQPEMQEAA